ncbi:MAG: MutS-related protein [Breznakia sp.]
MKTNIYQAYISDYQIKAKRQDRFCLFIAIIKFSVLCMFLWMLYNITFVSRDSNRFFILCILFIVCVCLFLYHGYQQDTLMYLQEMIHINKRYIKRIEGTWTDFADGREFMDYEHLYTSDLDIFGKDSLYQYINVAHTKEGKEKFANDLRGASYSIEDIEKRQIAIEELSQMHDFSFAFEYHAEKIIVQNQQAFIHKIKQSKTPNIPSFLYALRHTAFVSVVMLFIVTTWNVRTLTMPLIGLLVIQSLLWIYMLLKANGFLSVGDNLNAYFRHFAALFSLMETTKFQSEYLEKQQDIMFVEKDSASQQIKRLNTIMQMVNIRKNALLSLLFNVFLVWDVWCVYRLEKWMKQNCDMLEDWFKSISEIESLLSFACFTRVCTHTSIPCVQQGDAFVAFDMAHPLIAENIRVANDFSFTKEIHIISGSNMSGKTTFLRTLGVNIILAKNGARVCAKKLQTPVFHLVSSMRIYDDLNAGISTFYQELRKIKEIVRMVEKEPQTLFLIDEIFKGTNSSDRIDGAKKIIHRLYKQCACGFLTTHDLAMCTYEDDTMVHNWHFEECIKSNEMSFDYKIKKGIATTTNGEFLMRLLSLIE